MQNKSICRSCFHSYVCDEFNADRDSNNKKCHYFNDHYVPADDVAEVVRCKDCKRCFKQTTRRYKQTMWLCMRHDFNVNVNPDDFCSYGERRGLCLDE